MVDIGTILRHYKREDIQKEMLRSAIGREVAVKYGDKGFGKRPDTLQYTRDILEFAKERATSFHVSEERWSNVFNLTPGLRPQELDELRTGWDLILDVDCPVWEYAKLITHHLILALKKHGVKSISCKFSGNKGFHIGVPFEAFFKKVGGKETRLWFPDKIKKILYYLSSYIDSKENKYAFTRDLLEMDKADVIADKMGLGKEDLFVNACNKCDNVFTDTGNDPVQKMQFQCPKCELGFDFGTDKDYTTCDKCGAILKKDDFVEPTKRTQVTKCPKCAGKDFSRKASPETLLNLDAMLISSRHMYRMVYSLHEKSGLVSVPIDPDRVRGFEKDMAKPENVNVGEFCFLDSSNSSSKETEELFNNVENFDIDIRESERRTSQFTDMKKSDRKAVEFEELQEAVPEEFFPPCINNIMAGLKDGKKRSMFILVNFLSNTGYSFDAIDEIMSEWNKKNHEPLREVIIKGQIRYRRTQKKKVLPANCDNKMYYKDIRICTPDNFCRRIKNPVNYAILKARIASGSKKGRQKLTEEQKEMRRKYREKKKKNRQTT